MLRALLSRCYEILIRLLLLAGLLALPFVLYSLHDEIRANASHDDTMTILEAGPSSADTLQLTLHLTRFNPIDDTISVRIIVHHRCLPPCTPGPVVLHVSDFVPAGHHAVPADQTLVLPAGSGEARSDLVLPVRGALYAYPFDRYALRVAIGAEENGRFFTPASQRLAIDYDENLTKVEDTGFRREDPARIRTRTPAASAFTITLQRPFYLRFVILFMTTLMMVATLNILFLMPFTDLLKMTAGLVFALWGLRQLLLGELPADVTYIDLFITLMAILILLTVALRSMLHVRHQRMHPPD